MVLTMKNALYVTVILLLLCNFHVANSSEVSFLQKLCKNVSLVRFFTFSALSQLEHKTICTNRNIETSNNFIELDSVKSCSSFEQLEKGA